MNVPLIHRIEEFEGWAKIHQKDARIYSEGDSWFAYPGTNVITEIHDDAKGDPVILQKAVAGDEASSMLSGKQRHTLVKELSWLKERSDWLKKKGSKFKIDPHFIVFSGGGNDIVGKFDLPLLIQKAKAGSPPAQFIQQDRFKNRLEQIRTAYIELGFIRDEFFVNCPIITHKYDYPIPSNQGVSVVGIDITDSWMKPFMDDLGINAKDQKGIAHYLIDEFGKMVDKLKKNKKINNFHVINTQGTLGPKDWQNEIHPTPKAFGRIAKMFRDKMKLLRPDLATRL